LNTFRQSSLPVSASRQSTISPSSTVSGRDRTSVNSRPSMMTGVEIPPPASLVQSTFSPEAASNEVTSGGPAGTCRSCRGPRQSGQSAAGAGSAAAAARAKAAIVAGRWTKAGDGVFPGESLLRMLVPS